MLKNGLGRLEDWKICTLDNLFVLLIRLIVDGDDVHALGATFIESITRDGNKRQLSFWSETAG